MIFSENAWYQVLYGGADTIPACDAAILDVYLNERPAKSEVDFTSLLLCVYLFFILGGRNAGKLFEASRKINGIFKAASFCHL